MNTKRLPETRTWYHRRRCCRRKTWTCRSSSWGRAGRTPHRRYPRCSGFPHQSRPYPRRSPLSQTSRSSHLRSENERSHFCHDNLTDCGNKTLGGYLLQLIFRQERQSNCVCPFYLFTRGGLINMHFQCRGEKSDIWKEMYTIICCSYFITTEHREGISLKFKVWDKRAGKMQEHCLQKAVIFHKLSVFRFFTSHSITALFVICLITYSVILAVWIYACISSL